MTNFPLTIPQAEQMNLCQTCGFAGRLAKEDKPCNYHRHPSLNYLHVPKGRCALTQEDITRREFEYVFVRGRFGKAVA